MKIEDINQEEESPHDKLARITKLIEEWDCKQGHNQCWYYPEIFREIAEICGVKTKCDKNLPTKEEFVVGCDLYMKELYEELD